MTRRKRSDRLSDWQLQEILMPSQHWIISCIYSGSAPIPAGSNVRYENFIRQVEKKGNPFTLIKKLSPLTTYKKIRLF